MLFLDRSINPIKQSDTGHVKMEIHKKKETLMWNISIIRHPARPCQYLFYKSINEHDESVDYCETFGALFNRHDWYLDHYQGDSFRR